MLSIDGEMALRDSLETGKAIVKFISANDVGLTGSHQYGFYLPKAAWQLFTPHAPVTGENNQHDVEILWPDGLITRSRVSWYGVRTRSEYRLTRFGNNFPWIAWNSSDNVGDLLIIVPHSIDQFSAYILHLEEDIDEILAGLGIEITDTWGYYNTSQMPEETEDQCVIERFNNFVQNLQSLPSGSIFSQTTVDALTDCIEDFDDIDPDSKLLRLVREEYLLYRIAEKHIFEPRIQQLFPTIDDFLKTANSILQARKSRAGRSLENHVEYILSHAGISYDIRPIVDGTRPDIIVPGVQQYEDPGFPIDDLFIIGIKRTCKDRWRQVTQEAPRIPRKYILTLQRGMSSNQFEEMTSLNVSLVVPKNFHSDFPPDVRPSLMTVQSFINKLSEHTYG